MTFTVLALAIGAAIGLCAGGRPRNISAHPVRAWWLLIVGVALQAAGSRVGGGAAGTLGFLATYACLLAFAAKNRTLIGMGIIAVGLGANALVIGLNGGMPVRAEAVVAAHISDQQGLAGVAYGHRHHRERSRDRLRWLGDIIPLPELHQVLSFGDVVLAVGVADVMAHLLQPRRRRRHGLSGRGEAHDPVGEGSVGGGVGLDEEAAGQELDVLAPVPAVPTQGDEMGQLAVTGPAADRLG